MIWPAFFYSPDWSMGTMWASERAARSRGWIGVGEIIFSLFRVPRRLTARSPATKPLVMQAPFFVLTSSKLSPTSPTKSLLPFLSIILAACSAFLMEVKSNAAMSGWLFLTFFSSKFLRVPFVAYLTTSVTYSNSFEESILEGASSLTGWPKS